jgi:MFS family permease
VPFAQWLIDRVGWRWAFQVIGIAALAWIVPATLWLVREPPGAEARAGRRTGGDPARAGEVTLLAAAATRAFWLLAAAQGFAAFVNQMLLVHQVAYLVDHGVPALVAASVVSVVGIASVVGKAGGGWLSDLIGREVTYTLGMALVVTSIGALGMQALQPGAAWAYLYGGLVGLGYAVTAPLMPAVISDLYRGRHFGAIFGALQTMNAVGGSLGPWVAGHVFDVTRSYRLAFLLAVAAAGLATAALWIAAPRRRGRPRLD